MMMMSNNCLVAEERAHKIIQALHTHTTAIPSNPRHKYLAWRIFSKILTTWNEKSVQIFKLNRGSVVTELY